jgi:two-component system OmpR family sensor kinase
MRRLAEAARRFARGELGYRVTPSGPDELAALGMTLNRMAGALQAQLEALEAARQREREAGDLALAELRRLHSEFVAVAAHELRTPVAAAKSYAELLRRDDVSLAPETRRLALQRLDVVCERLARLVRSLLGASRIEAGRLELQCEPVDLGALVTRVCADMAAYVNGHDLQVRLRPAHHGTPAEPVPPAGSTLVLADAERVEDVLVNLGANAATYAPEGTEVQVHVVPREGAVEVLVADQGPGIPEEEQAAIFERFRRGRGISGSGVGLGLYIAKAYVQRMGGEIGVRSTPGHGATFWFRLPSPRAAQPAPRRPAAAPAVAGEGRP